MLAVESLETAYGQSQVLLPVTIGAGYDLSSRHSAWTAFTAIANPTGGFEEHPHLTVWKNRLDELGLPSGPWLPDLKRRVRAGHPDSARRSGHW